MQPAELFPIGLKETELRREEATSASGEEASEVLSETVLPGRRGEFRYTTHIPIYTRGAVMEFRGVR